MANYYYGVNKGDNEYAAAVGTSTTSKDVEVFVNGTNVTDRQAVMNALEKLMNFIIRQPFPPA